MSGDIIPDDDENGESPDSKAKKHDDFLLAEYSSIAQAYFNTTTTIATFFKNYLVIVGLPIPIFVFLLTQLSRGGTLPKLPDELAPLIPVIAGLIGLLGLCVMIYIVNLRLDALLYARTVNGIRRHFYEHSDMKFRDELRTRVLPRSALQPRYFEWHYFMSVIAVFTVLNLLYPLLGAGWVSPSRRVLGTGDCLYLLGGGRRVLGGASAHLLGPDTFQGNQIPAHVQDRAGHRRRAQQATRAFLQLLAAVVWEDHRPAENHVYPGRQMPGVTVHPFSEGSYAALPDDC
jgi:hypothetical protein